MLISCISLLGIVLSDICQLQLCRDSRNVGLNQLLHAFETPQFDLRWGDDDDKNDDENDDDDDDFKYNT